jgi:hypothetical protein
MRLGIDNKMREGKLSRGLACRKGTEVESTIFWGDK